MIEQIRNSYALRYAVVMIVGLWLVNSCSTGERLMPDGSPYYHPHESQEQLLTEHPERYDQEEIRKAKVEAECARYPERCQDWDALLYDDSNLPDDPCRDYGICNGESSFTGQSSDHTSSGCPNGCTSWKAGCDIKGNKSYDTGEKIYHVPGQTFYNETTINSAYGERWFCTEQEAVANGWRKALN